MVHTPGSHLLTTNQTRTHRSQQSILLQLFFATQCYTSGSEIWDLHAKLGLFWDQIWTLGPIWDRVPNLGLHYSACVTQVLFKRNSPVRAGGLKTYSKWNVGVLQ